MAFDKATLDRWYQGLNQTHVDLKRNFDSLNKGVPLSSMQTQVTNLGRTIDALGVMIKQFQTQMQDAAKTASVDGLIQLADFLDEKGYYGLTDKVVDVIKIGSKVGSFDLIKLADYFDNNSLFALADKVDEVCDIICVAEEYGFVPKARASTLENDANDEPIQRRSRGSLSTRYCPDHRGVQAIRVEENVYQCPIDGKKYNYEIGYVNYEGQRVPGGSIASQTPTTSDFGGIPMRIYDSRSDVLNRMN